MMKSENIVIVFVHRRANVENVFLGFLGLNYTKKTAEMTQTSNSTSRYESILQRIKIVDVVFERKKVTQ